LIVAYCVDKQVIKREEAGNGNRGEYSGVNGVKNAITRCQLEHLWFLLEFALRHYIPPSGAFAGRFQKCLERMQNQSVQSSS
jgi:hypothetical protein